MAEEENVTAGTYWGSDGNGRYQDDYDYLVDLVPRHGKAKTLAGEIMRAVMKMNKDFYTRGNLNLVATNFLAMAGIFNRIENDLAIMYPYAKGSTHYDGVYDGDELQLAVERTNDRCIEFILEYPDLEYTENSIDMTMLRAGFMERVLSAHVTTPKTHQVKKIPTPSCPTTCNEMKDQLQGISTPRIANIHCKRSEPGVINHHTTPSAIHS